MLRQRAQFRMTWMACGNTQELAEMFVSDRAKLARRRYVRSWIVGIVVTVATGVAANYIVRLIDIALGCH